MELSRCGRGKKIGGARDVNRCPREQSLFGKSYSNVDLAPCKLSEETRYGLRDEMVLGTTAINHSMKRDT